MKKLFIILLVLLLIFIGKRETMAQCHAGFTYKVYNGDSAVFKDSSSSVSGNMLYHYWNFGDGYKSGSVNPIHIYSNPGTYWVCHSIYTSTGCKDTICDSIHIQGSKPHCDATFGSYMNQNNGDSLRFFPKSFRNFKSYAWSFGDGTYSHDRYPWHVYNKPGKYYVCLQVTDSNSAGKCDDLRCDSINYGSSANNPVCDASFGFQINKAHTDSVVFFSKSTTKYLTYSWSFGDGNYSKDKEPWHVYHKPGTYYVCMKVTDSNASGKCTDIECDSITVPGASSGCQAEFAYSTQGKTVSFTNKSSGITSTTHYKYYFDDGDSSDNANPTHAYSKNGTYNVCLILSDSSTGCNSKFCKTLYISNKYYLYGTVKTSNGSSFSSNDHGHVWAIKYDSAAGTLTAVDSTTWDSDFRYKFYLPAGEYIVKAALDSGSTHYKDFLPTYHEHKLHWDSANAVHLYSNQGNINIYMIKGNNPGGPGFIGGYVSQGANKTGAVGDPVAGVEVILYNNLMEPIDYTYSKADGTYAFYNIAYGTYYVHPEVVGKETYHLSVTIDANKDARRDVNITVNSVYVLVETGIDIIADRENIITQIFPNPVKDLLQININPDKNYIGKMMILDIQGKTVYQENIISKNTITLDVSTFPQGIYSVMIQTHAGAIFSRRFVKQ